MNELLLQYIDISKQILELDLDTEGEKLEILVENRGRLIPDIGELTITEEERKLFITEVEELDAKIVDFLKREMDATNLEVEEIKALKSSSGKTKDALGRYEGKTQVSGGSVYFDKNT